MSYTIPPTPGRRHRLRQALAVAAAALVLVGVTAAATPAKADPPAPAGPPAAAASRLLIGMGDSYSTGGWIPPVDPSSGLCNRSLHAYPLVAAGELGFDGQSVACGGAVLADFTSPSRRGAPPQTTDIADADILAWTMGGNDVGGPGGVLDSGADAASVTDFAAAVDALTPQLVAAYGDVQRAAPRAQMFVLGYPDIVPRTQQALEACLGARAAGLDIDDIHRNVALLNDAIGSAAAAAGAVYVDTSPSFAGHEMCTVDPFANAPEERAPTSPGGGMHPNERGHLMLAADLIAAIGTPAGPPVTDPPVPAPPVTDPLVPAPPVVGPPAIPIPGLTPQERAVARVIAVALQHRIRGGDGHPGMDRRPW